MNVRQLRDGPAVIGRSIEGESHSDLQATLLDKYKRSQSDERAHSSDA